MGDLGLLLGDLGSIGLNTLDKTSVHKKVVYLRFTFSLADTDL